MAYTRVHENWLDDDRTSVLDPPSPTATPVMGADLEHIEDGIYEAHLLADRALLEKHDTVDFDAWTASRDVVAGTGLTGGGSLANDVTLSVAYGTTAGTAAQGNDARFGTILPKPASPTTGALLYYNGSAWVPLAKGTQGQHLVAGASAPVYVTVGTTGVPNGTAKGQLLCYTGMAWAVLDPPPSDDYTLKPDTAGPAGVAWVAPSGLYETWEAPNFLGFADGGAPKVFGRYQDGVVKPTGAIVIYSPMGVLSGNVVTPNAVNTMVTLPPTMRPSAVRTMTTSFKVYSVDSGGTTVAQHTISSVSVLTSGEITFTAPALAAGATQMRYTYVAPGTSVDQTIFTSNNSFQI